MKRGCWDSWEISNVYVYGETVWGWGNTVKKYFIKRKSVHFIHNSVDHQGLGKGVNYTIFFTLHMPDTGCYQCVRGDGGGGLMRVRH